ncbi:helix-turn-helix transcriptional regulator [Chromatocurvus halotolerans]|uniref:Helix-turn-helix protein n=1 Tax=Chromatocurvus halotolerans TaxID=1132028 RepID=A0A4R2KRZ9_9GAMM|nr:helix-turn-helix transcriptional regulator [Chromatocurvus halotolerans]TCO73769.1 helix-turn-helix protein [Chromatocurvus halotolerans]
MSQGSFVLEFQGVPAHGVLVCLAVRGCRNILGMSQADLAWLSGVSKPTIARIETGKTDSVRTDTVDKLLAAFRVLGVGVQWVEGGFSIQVNEQAAQIGFFGIVGKREDDATVFSHEDIETGEVVEESAQAALDRLIAMNRELSKRAT